jgi:hypothetical protein
MEEGVNGLHNDDLLFNCVINEVLPSVTDKKKWPFVVCSWSGTRILTFFSTLARGATIP